MLAVLFARGTVMYALGPGIVLACMIAPILFGVWLSERGRS